MSYSLHLVGITKGNTRSLDSAYTLTNPTPHSSCDHSSNLGNLPGGGFAPLFTVASAPAGGESDVELDIPLWAIRP